jgi:hypothetical protein
MTNMYRRDLLMAVAVLGGASPGRAQRDDHESPIDAIVRSIAAGSLARVDVLRLPLAAQYRVNVTPERLESWCENRVSLRYTELSREGLFTALKSVRLSSSSAKFDSLDVRWGAIFYSTQGGRIASFYFDKKGGHGALNTSVASFGPDFFPDLMRALHVSIK